MAGDSQAQSKRRKTLDMWLPLRELNHSLERVLRDYKEITLFGNEEKKAGIARDETIPTSREISLFIIAFL